MQHGKDTKIVKNLLPLPDMKRTFGRGVRGEDPSVAITCGRKTNDIKTSQL